MKKVTVKEYDTEGRLLKETITEEDEQVVTNPLVYPGYPVYPSYPIVQPQLPWYDGTICVTWQKGENI
jgi:hypothetical protein